MVALFTRAWIEMTIDDLWRSTALVALFTRAWIEIYRICQATLAGWVALFTRAWIEIKREKGKTDMKLCRPLYEGVD